MGWLITMHHYVSKDVDGNIHVQNVVAGHMGQHHVHTLADYYRWAMDVPEIAIEWLDSTECDCGLKVGECK